MAYGMHPEPDGDEPDGDEPDGDEGGEDNAGGPFGDAIREAFPDNDWTADKIDALKEAIRICYHEDEAGGAPGGPPPPGHGKGLALIFGAPKKK